MPLFVQGTLIQFNYRPHTVQQPKNLTLTWALDALDLELGFRSNKISSPWIFFSPTVIRPYQVLRLLSASNGIDIIDWIERGSAYEFRSTKSKFLF
jgi:hypothetical protein